MPESAEISELVFIDLFQKKRSLLLECMPYSIYWMLQALLLHGWCWSCITSSFACLIFLVAQTGSREYKFQSGIQVYSNVISLPKKLYISYTLHRSVFKSYAYACTLCKL